MKEEYISMETLEEISKLKKENKYLKQELKNKPDAKYTLTTADGKEFTIIQSERIDMQEELNKTILGLQQRIDKAIELLNKPQFEYDNIPCNYEEDIMKLKSILRGEE